MYLNVQWNQRMYWILNKVFPLKQTLVSLIHATQVLHLPKLFIAQLMTSIEFSQEVLKPLNTRTQSFISFQDKTFGTQILLCKKRKIPG